MSKIDLKGRLLQVLCAIVVVAIAVALTWGNVQKLLNPEPEPLIMVVIPAEAELLTKEQFAPLIDYLTEKIGQTVELMAVADYTAVVEAMKYGHADIARFGPFNYVLATQEADVEAVAVAIKKKTGKPNYRAFLIAQEVITDFNGRTMAYVDISSASGYLIPATYIQANNIELGEVFFAGSHSAVIEAIKNGTVELGAVADNRYYVALEEGVITEGEIVIVWESELIPNSPVAVQKSMDAELKQRVIEAFLSAPKNIVEELGIGETGYVIAIDSDYDPIREVQKMLDK